MSRIPVCIRSHFLVFLPQIRREIIFVLSSEMIKAGYHPEDPTKPSWIENGGPWVQGLDQKLFMDVST